MEKIKINLSAEQIKEKYGDRLQPEMEGLMFDIISRLFKEIIKINILIPGDFRSSKGDDCIKCSVKAWVSKVSFVSGEFIRPL